LNNLKNFGIVLFLLLFGLPLGSCKNNKNDKNRPSESKKTYHKKYYKKHDSFYKNKELQTDHISEIPAKVVIVRDYVRKNNKAMDGYVGGRVFKNLEQNLPKTDTNGTKIKYQEWDVNEKINGKNRGRERLITGSDGSDYYTNNHYKSFLKLDI
jgi:ribonuclease T1